MSKKRVRRSWNGPHPLSEEGVTWRRSHLSLHQVALPDLPLRSPWARMDGASAAL